MKDVAEKVEKQEYDSCLLDKFRTAVEHISSKLDCVLEETGEPTEETKKNYDVWAHGFKVGHSHGLGESLDIIRNTTGKK